MPDIGDKQINLAPSVSVNSLIKGALAVGSIVAAFYVIIAGVKSDITAESKANSLSIYNLQVELAVTKNSLDTVRAEVKQIREDEKQSYSEINANLARIITTVTSIQISFAALPQAQPARAR